MIRTVVYFFFDSPMPWGIIAYMSTCVLLLLVLAGIVRLLYKVTPHPAYVAGATVFTLVAYSWYRILT